MPGQKFGPAWFPGLVAAGLGLCGLGLIFKDLRERRAWLAWPDWMRRARPRLAVAAVLGGLLFYVLAADALGFYLTAVLRSVAPRFATLTYAERATTKLQRSRFTPVGESEHPHAGPASRTRH